MREIKFMSAQEAVELMEKTVDVYDWNQKRHLIKYNIDPAILPSFLILVDTTKMVKRVAKANNWPKVYAYSYYPEEQTDDKKKTHG